MKKLIMALLSTLTASAVFAQQPVKTAQLDTTQLLNQADNSKTMNRQQVITNYLQAEAHNITSTSKNVQLKASIFALNPKDSAAKYKDDYYLKHPWQRNTQLLIGGGLDKNNKINGFSAGFTSNLFNKRDLSAVRVFKYEIGTYNTKVPAIDDAIDKIRNDALRDYYDKKLAEIKKNLLEIAKKAFDQKSDQTFETDLIAGGVSTDQQPALKSDKFFLKEYADLDKQLLDCIAKNSFDLKPDVKSSPIYLIMGYIASHYDEDPLNDALTTYINNASKNGAAPKLSGAPDADLIALIAVMNAQVAKQQDVFPAKTLADVYVYLHTQYKNASSKLASRPLLALGYNFSYASTGINYQHVPSLQFLWGLGGKHSSNEYEFTATATDTLATDTTKKSKPLDRNIGTIQLGINKVLFTDKSSVSLLETIFAFEEDHIFSTPYAKEKDNKVFVSVALQGRPSAKSPWFKLLVKYNKNANFLGFLDVTLNLDNSSNKSN